MSVNARPILFSAPMVRGLLDGRKTQTRRILKGTKEHRGPYNPAYIEAHQQSDGWAKICPYGPPGDLLWVREPWRVVKEYDAFDSKTIMVASGGDMVGCVDYSSTSSNPDWVGRRRHARYMPRWASRLTLELTGVRVERLQDISEADAKAEGFADGWMGDPMPETPIGNGWSISSPGTYASAAGHFQVYWCELHGFDAWDADPWVWVLEFMVHCRNVDELLKARAA